MQENFVDHFWGSEFNSTTGFEALTQRMKQGKQTLTDFTEYVKKRSQIEQRYGKEMCQLANSMIGRDEFGTLHNGLEVLQSETLEIGKVSIYYSEIMLDTIERTVREFRDVQRESRKKIEDGVRKSIKHKKTSYDHMLKCQATYQKACIDSDKSSELLQQNMTQPSKKVEDLKQKMKRARQVAETSDKEYSESVSQLEEAKVMWEKEYTSYCQAMQTLEEARIAKLRSALWYYTNTCSTCLVEIDSHHEEVRKTLERCDITHDVNTFIKQHKTGRQKPASIPYENFYKSDVKIPLAENTPTENHRAGPVTPYERVVALYDYVAQGPEELSLAQGDLLVVLEKIDEVWWYGKHKNGSTGVFPASYVHVMPL